MERKKINEPIAIVGIGCNLPGGSHGPDRFWKLLVNGTDAITEVPSERWSTAFYYDPEQGKPTKTYSKWGGFVSGVNLFDPVPFGIQEREAQFMDPQQRLLLEATWEAFEDAGMRLDISRPKHIGVFVGISTFDYALIQNIASEYNEPDPYSATGTSLSIAANRISYCFNLTGPSLIVDTACSSALTALDMACRSIWNGECEAAVTGGVNALLSPGMYLAFCTINMLSPDGRCKAFDQRANGFVRSEGAGMVVLKPLSAAQAAGDRIYAVIRGTGTNQDGRTPGMTVPNPVSQESLIRHVCKGTGINPADIQYMEAHGTGTAVGDPIEARALGGAVGAGRSTKNFCRIGSVKTNLGHLEAGSGIAGLIKTALTLYHGIIPPSLHFETPNPNIDFEALRLRVVTECEPYMPGRRLAGLNSFGFGGANAHALLEATDDVLGKSRKGASRPSASKSKSKKVGGADAASQAQVLVLSARNEVALKAQAKHWAAYLESAPDSLADICRAAAIQRTPFEYRMAAVASSAKEMSGLLTTHASGEKSPFLVSHFQPDNVAPPEIVFVYSGQGPQWWAMGRELWSQEPVFREKIVECAEALRDLGGWDLRKELLAEEKKSRMSETEIAQPAITAVQIALTALWNSWGIKPAAVVGHSVGEVAAAYAAGVYSLADAMRVIYHRGRCMELTPLRGKMIAAGLTAEKALLQIKDYGDRLSLAAINSPNSVSISGDSDAVEEMAAKLEKLGILVRNVPVNYAFHSAHMDPVREELVASLKGLRPRAPKIPIYSTVTGDQITGKELSASYWWKNVREAVQFAPAIAKLASSGYDTFLELAAHPVLSNSMQECLAPIRPGTVLPSLRRHTPERPTMLVSLAALCLRGVQPDWAAVIPGESQHVSLPTYGWDKKLYWNEPPISREVRLSPSPHPLMMFRQRVPDRSWEGQLDRRVNPWLNDHRVQGHMVFPGAGYIEMALSSAMEAAASSTIQLEDVEFVKPLFIPSSGDVPTIRITHSSQDSGFRLFSRRGDITNEWSFHSSGKQRPLTRHAPAPMDTVEAIRARCNHEHTGEAFYEHMASCGLIYGPMFQAVRHVWYRQGESLGEIVLPQKLESSNHRYAFHPSLLDACIQVTTCTHHSETKGSDLVLRLPVFLERIRYYAHPGERFWAHTWLVRDSSSAASYDCTVYSDKGEVLIEFKGMKGQVVHGNKASAHGPIEKLFYEQEWQLAPLSTHQNKSHPAIFFPKTSRLVSKLQERAAQRATELGLQERYAEVKPKVDDLCAALLERALEELEGKPVNGVSAASISGVAPQMVPALERLLARRESREGKSSHEKSELERKWREIVNAFPAFLPDMILLDRCGEALVKILKGELSVDEAMVPGGALNQLEQYYAKSFRFRVPHDVLRLAIAEIIGGTPEGRRLKILEVGAGTGGLSAEIVPALQEGLADYYFTDKSAETFSRVEQKLRDYSFVKYEVFDLNYPPDQALFQAHSFDLIIAGSVLQATSSLQDSLAHLRGLLAPGGMLLIENVAADSWLDDLTFGLSEGNHPSPLTGESSKALLSPLGFTDIENVTGTDSGPIVILARAPGASETTTTENSTAVLPEAKSSGTWLLLEDKKGWARKIGQELKIRGQDCIYAQPGEALSRKSADEFLVNPSQPEEMVKLLAELPHLKGILHLWSLDTNSDATSLTAADLVAAERLTCHATLHLVKALEGKSTPPQLWLLTAGAQAVGKIKQPLNVAQAPLIGLGRNIINEVPELNCRLVDFSRESNPFEIAALVDELFVDAAEAEEEIALRSEARFRQRLVPRYDRVDRAPKDYAQAKDVPCRLDAVRPGSIDGIAFVPLPRRAPASDEVEIEVYAAGLNFRDVMKSLGIYPAEVGDALLLGDECSGRIVAVGKDVTDFKVGDEVITMGIGCFAPFITQKAMVVMPKPANFSFEESATLLTCYNTAHYALRYLGRMRKGESVLIHAAAGGVGIAAVQLALMVGAKVYATAGSPEKRRFLDLLGVEQVFDSRSLDFADEVLEATHGRGVDLVLNSLAGEAISRSLSALAPGGRFLEIGKKDIYMNTPIGLRPFRNNLSYFAIDLGRALEPEMADVFISELKPLFQNSGIKPLPHRVFPASDAMEAFRHMTQARQIGKIVLDFRNARVPLTEVTPPVVMRCKADATYLVIGGVGGFGLATAQWLATHGARNIVLASRSANPTPEARAIITELEKTGVKVVLAKCDAANTDDAAALIADIHAKLPPLKGVIHSAMVLDDGMLVQMTAESFQKVMASKVQGAWNLHELTKNLSLDLFVLYSSSSSTIGNPGQANYCAANAFLDALSHLRRHLGLPSLTVNWGLLGEVGVITRDAKLAEHFRRLGFEGLPTRTALNALGFLLMARATQTTVWDIDWSRWIEAPAHYARSKRYSLLTTVDALKQNQRGEGERLRAALDAAAPADQILIAQDCLRTQVAEVLRVSAAKIELERPLNEQGMDSLMAVELMHRLDSNLGISISPTKLIGKPTIIKLAESVLEALGKTAKSGESASTQVDGSVKTDTEIDLKGEVRVPDDFPKGTAALQPRQYENPRQVVLTGPTTYLGLYLLNDLLEQTSARVICFMTEGADVDVLRRQLLQDLKTRKLTPKDADRIIVQQVDFTSPHLGLSETDFARLASETDLIIHNYAQVNHIGSYKDMKAANVGGTLEVIRLAAQHHFKPLHYISSVSVFGASQSNSPVGMEDDPLEFPEKLQSGYDATRWVAEKSLRLAETHGVPVTIYRPGFMWGDSQNFISTPDDLAWRLVLTCIGLGRGPLGNMNLFVTPVDFVSHAICALFRKEEALGGTFHVVSPYNHSLEEILVFVRNVGYPVELIPAKEWEASLQGKQGSGAIDQILPYLMFRGALWNETMQANNSHSLDTTRLQAGLKGTRVSCPPLTEELMAKYLQDFVRLKLLPKPQKAEA
jgi:thioester reductase-like protein